jgi:hypothetical protein
MDAYNELNGKITNLNNKIIANTNSIDKINATIDILARKSDLGNESARLHGELTLMSETITLLETKLQKVYLPNSTKYFLDETELSNLRNKIRQMNAILVRMQNLEKTIVQTLTRLDQKLNDVSSTV